MQLLLGQTAYIHAITAWSLRVRRFYLRDLFRAGKVHMPVVHLKCVD